MQSILSKTRTLLAILFASIVGVAPFHHAIAAASNISAEYWPTRQGTAERVLLIKGPDSQRGVVLLPGGHGNINLNSQAQIGWGQDDFLVRTRALYANAGITVAIPDIPVDHKPPASLRGYRTTDQQAYDFRAVTGRMRRIVDRVWVIAFDQAATGALNAVAKDDADLISGLVLVSPVFDPNNPVMIEGARSAAKKKIPLLVLSHANDPCSAPPVARLDKIAEAASGAPYRSVRLHGGGGQLPIHLSYYPDTCNRTAAHALVGLEQEATGIILDWIATVKARP